MFNLFMGLFIIGTVVFTLVYWTKLLLGPYDMPKWVAPILIAAPFLMVVDLAIGFSLLTN